MEANESLVLIFSRNAFYKRMHFLVLLAFALSLIVMMVLTWVLIVVIRHPSLPLYFATNQMGELIQVVPVNQPNMSTKEVTTWAIDAVQEAYSYDYINYRGQLQGAQKYFATYGWLKFMDALTASNNLVALTQRKMIVLARVVDQPKIITEGILSGAYAWKFQIPVLITYWLPPYDDQSKFANALTVDIILQRQPILQSYKGLGILQIVGGMAEAGSVQSQEI